MPGVAGNGNEHISHLRQIAEQALACAGGDGLAVVLSRQERLVCAISLGFAPPVGSPLAAASPLSRECLERAMTVYCADTHHDRRVARSPLPAVRSVLLVPILRAGKTVGLIVTFARRPDAFDARQFFLLNDLADDMAALLMPSGPPASAAPEPKTAPAQAGDRQPAPSASAEPTASARAILDTPALRGIEEELEDWALWDRQHWRKKILVLLLAVLLCASAVTAVTFRYQIGQWVRIVRMHIRWSHQPPAAPRP